MQSHAHCARHASMGGRRTHSLSESSSFDGVRSSSAADGAADGALACPPHSPDVPCKNTSTNFITWSCVAQRADERAHGHANSQCTCGRRFFGGGSRTSASGAPSERSLGEEGSCSSKLSPPSCSPAGVSVSASRSAASRASCVFVAPNISDCCADSAPSAAPESAMPKRGSRSRLNLPLNRGGGGVGARGRVRSRAACVCYCGLPGYFGGHTTAPLPCNCHATAFFHCAQDKQPSLFSARLGFSQMCLLCKEHHTFLAPVLHFLCSHRGLENPFKHHFRQGVRKNRFVQTPLKHWC